MVRGLRQRKHGRAPIDVAAPARRRAPRRRPTASSSTRSRSCRSRRRSPATRSAAPTCSAARWARRSPRRWRSRRASSSRARWTNGVDAGGRRAHLRPARVLRRLRLQQEPLGRVRAHHVPDGVAQGALPGRAALRDPDERQGPDREGRPHDRRRARDGDDGAAARRQRERHRLQGRLHAPGRATGPSRRSERIKDALGPADPLRPRRGARASAGRRSRPCSRRAHERAVPRTCSTSRRASTRSASTRRSSRRSCSAARSTRRCAERGVTRARAFASIDVALERSRAASRDREAGQTNLFGLFDAAPRRRRGAAPSAGRLRRVRAVGPPRDARARAAVARLLRLGPPARALREGRGGPRQGRRASPSPTCAAMDDWAVVKLAGHGRGLPRAHLQGRRRQDRLLRARGPDGPREREGARRARSTSTRTLLTAGEPVLVEGKVSFPQRGEDEPEEPDGPREPTILLNAVRPLSDAVRADTRSIAIRVRADRTRPADLASLAQRARRREGQLPGRALRELRRRRRGGAHARRGVAGRGRRRAALGHRAHLRRAGGGAAVEGRRLCRRLPWGPRPEGCGVATECGGGRRARPFTPRGIASARRGTPAALHPSHAPASPCARHPGR